MPGLKHNYIKWSTKIKISRYFKIKYIPLLALLNASFLAYWLLPLPLIQFIPLMLISVIIMKWLRMSILYEVLLADPKDCSTYLLQNFNKEMTNFCWFVNKFNFRCFLFISSICCLFWLLQHYLSSSASWWLLINMIIGYIGATKTTKSQMKFLLGYYRQYQKYMIRVIQPNSPGKSPSDSESSQEEIRE